MVFWLVWKWGPRSKRTLNSVRGVCLQQLSAACHVKRHLVLQRLEHQPLPLCLQLAAVWLDCALGSSCSWCLYKSKVQGEGKQGVVRLATYLKLKNTWGWTK